jgi:hypothetical protein
MAISYILAEESIIATEEEELEKLLEGIDFKNLTAEQITGKEGLLKLLTKKIVEKAMSAGSVQYLSHI